MNAHILHRAFLHPTLFNEPLHKMDRATWDAVVDTDLSSLFNMSRNVIDGMRERGFGRIINYSGIAPFVGHGPAKGAVKLGIVGFTRGLAQAHGDDVLHTVVDGRVVYRDRRHTTLDVEQVCAEVREIARAIAASH